MWLHPLLSTCIFRGSVSVPPLGISNTSVTTSGLVVLICVSKCHHGPCQRRFCSQEICSWPQCDCSKCCLLPVRHLLLHPQKTLIHPVQTQPCTRDRSNRAGGRNDQPRQGQKSQEGAQVWLLSQTRSKRNRSSSPDAVRAF